MDAMNDVVRRLERLERENSTLRRICLLGCGLLGALALIAWRSPKVDTFDSLQVHRLEVLDARGVPMITLSPTRDSGGGSIVLRDSSGDKRSWWESEIGGGRIVFESPIGTGDDRTIAGLSTTPGKAQMSLLGPKGGSVLNSVQNDHPSVSLQDTAGRSLFSAPWQH